MPTAHAPAIDAGALRTCAQIRAHSALVCAAAFGGGDGSAALRSAVAQLLAMESADGDANALDGASPAAEQPDGDDGPLLTELIMRHASVGTPAAKPDAWQWHGSALESRFCALLGVPPNTGRAGASAGGADDGDAGSGDGGAHAGADDGADEADAALGAQQEQLPRQQRQSAGGLRDLGHGGQLSTRVRPSQRLRPCSRPARASTRIATRAAHSRARRLPSPRVSPPAPQSASEPLAQTAPQPASVPLARMASDALGLFAQPQPTQPHERAAAAGGGTAASGGFSGMDDFFGGGPPPVPPRAPPAGADIFGLDALLGASNTPPALPPPDVPAPGGAAPSPSSALLSGALASLGLGSSWDAEQQRWIDAMPRLGYLAAERLTLPLAPPVLNSKAQAALAELRGT